MPLVSPRPIAEALLTLLPAQPLRNAGDPSHGLLVAYEACPFRDRSSSGLDPRPLPEALGGTCWKGLSSFPPFLKPLSPLTIPPLSPGAPCPSFHPASHGSDGEVFSDLSQPVTLVWSAQLAEQRAQFRSRLPHVKFTGCQERAPLTTKNGIGVFCWAAERPAGSISFNLTTLGGRHLFSSFSTSGSC